MSEHSPTPTTEPAHVTGPVAATERIETIDILRGFAIFGILLVNMAWFNSPVYLYVTDTQWWTGTADRIAIWFIRFIAEGKFYSLFSFLFGLGLTLQMTRIESRGVRFVPFYRRRLFVLLLIGLVHGFLLWAGDILAAYAMLGFLLLIFRPAMRDKPKTLVIWAAISLFIPVLLVGLGFAAIELGRMNPQAAEQIDASFAQSAAEYEALTEQSFKAYSQGSYAEIMAQRTRDLGFMYFAMLFLGPNIFAFFLLGMYIGRHGFLENISTHISLIRRVMWFGLGMGILANTVFVIAREYSNPSVPSLLSFVHSAAFFVGAPAFCFFFVAAIIVLTQNKAWKNRLSPLVAVGRTAISNYLFQSLVCTTIFYSYGFGLYGKVGPALGILFTIAIFTFQVFLSRWWLQRFRFGPVEWLWRSVTYGKLQPMRFVHSTIVGG